MQKHRAYSGKVSDYVSGFLGLSEGNAWGINAFDVSNSSVDFLTTNLAFVYSRSRTGTERRSVEEKAITSALSSTSCTG